MMVGGLFMLGFGMIAMLLVIGLLIAVLIWALTRRGNSPLPAPVPVNQNLASARACPHCGVALQADWSHCPQCGAPV